MIWINPKVKGYFKGSYVFAKGDRVFQLTNGKKTISFESWQQAKNLGWSTQ
jgi:hypothetical protein